MASWRIRDSHRTPVSRPLVPRTRIFRLPGRWPSPGFWAIFFVLLFSTAGASLAQSFCGRTLDEWRASGDRVIDRRNATSCDQPIEGTGDRDLILGASCDDRIHGRPGDDCIYGFAGNDTIYGDAGDDEIHAGAGNDLVHGDSGHDTIYGDAGGDELVGDSGRDRLFGGTGDDRLKGDSGRDELYGGRGDDQLKGDSGRDLLCGQGNDDRLRADSSRDRLDGGLGRDVCNGGAAKDQCHRCESFDRCSEEAGSLCPDDPDVLTGVADPGCTVCARDTANDDLYCSKADGDGRFIIASGEVAPSTTSADLPTSGTFEVFCVRCHGDAVEASPHAEDLDVRCTPCNGTEIAAGACDYFQGCSDGRPAAETASPSSDLYQFLYQNFVLATPGNPRPPIDFDEIPGEDGVPANSAFGHTFVGLPADLCAAELTVTARASSGAGSGNATNDGLSLEIQGPGGPFAWGQRFAALSGTQWTAGTLATVSVDLANLPPNGQNLLSSLADGQLDAYAQDDTGVDCMKLCLRPCTDLAIEKTITDGFRDVEPHWGFTLTVRNAGSSPTSGTITVTDALPDSLAFVSGGGDNWTCEASGQVVTCVYSGPPIPAGAETSIPIVVRPASRDAFQDLENCASVEMEGDTDPSNDRACESLPCPDPADPNVHYLDGSRREPSVCAASGPEICTEDQTWFWGTCGCGCLDPEEPCPDPEDPRVDYVSQETEICSIIRFTCDPGETLFSNSCGCGCVTPPECPVESDPGYDYISRDLDLCSRISFYCPGGSPFHSPCGCGCSDFDPTTINLRFFASGWERSEIAVDAPVDLPTSLDLGSSWGFEIEAEWRFASRFGLAFSAAYLRDEIRTRVRLGSGGEGSGGESSGGEVFFDETRRGDTWLFALGGRWHAVQTGRFDLYAGPFVAGLDPADPPGFRASSALGFGATLGLDLAIGDGWGVAGQLRYLDIEIDLAPTTELPLGEETIDLDRWSLGLGVSKRF